MTTNKLWISLEWNDLEACDRCQDALSTVLYSLDSKIGWEAHDWCLLYFRLAKSLGKLSLDIRIAYLPTTYMMTMDEPNIEHKYQLLQPFSYYSDTL